MPAQAGLNGAAIDVAAYYPTSTNIYDDPGNRVVSAAIEYPAGSYPTYNSSWQVDAADSTLTITNTTSGFAFATATFNGFILRVISGPIIASASADASSDFLPTSVTVQGGNEILVNFSGVDHDNTLVSSVINFTTVPEPATVGMLVTGLSIVGGVRLFRRRITTKGYVATKSTDSVSVGGSGAE